MALTANFKKFVVIVALIAVPAVFYVVGKDKNYWGLLDKKPAPVQVAAPAQEELLPEPQSATQEVPAPAPARQARQPYQQREPVPASELPQPLPFETKPQPQPAQPDATINKMKGLDKL